MKRIKTAAPAPGLSWVLALAAGLAITTACGGGTRTAAKTPTSANGTSSAARADGATAASGTTAPTTPTAPVDPEAARRALVEQALARVPQILDEVADLRGRAFLKTVPSAYQSTDDFRAFIKRETAASMGADKAESIATALHHIGLLPEKIDIVAALEDTMVSQAAAYYDPKQAAFFVVMAFADRMMQDVVASHELMHALQDQHFPLRAYYGEDAKGVSSLSEDELNARRFVVEGEASFIMLAHTLKAQSGSNPLTNAARPGLTQMIAMMAMTTTLEQMKAQAKAQAAAAGDDPDLKRSADAMDRIPPALLVPLFESYTKGAAAIDAAHADGGWKAVETLFTDPPQSTEQVLHPKDKLFPVRDLPVNVTLPSFKGLKELHQDTLGELQWRVYFQTWGIESKLSSEGWDGDRLGVYRDDNGKLVALLASEWDSPEDAQQFLAAYHEALGKRFGVAAAGNGAPPVSRPDGGMIETKRVGKRVFIIDGGSAGRLDQFARMTKFAPAK